MKKVEAKVLNKIRRPVITKLWTLNVSQRISTVLKIAVDVYKRQVYTQINLGIGGESNLQVPGQPIYLTSSQPDAKSLGYNGQGIVVIRLNDTEYACWDATCTNCQELTSHFTKEDLDGELAVCPVCHTQFSLRYGTPFNLTYEIYPLKGYPISKVRCV